MTTPTTPSDDLEAAARAATDPKTWWFLENAEGRWLHDDAHGTFTSDPNAALKWPNETRANDFRVKLRTPLWALKATEHMWVDPGPDWSEFEDEISDAISDSIDMDWTSRDGARAVVDMLKKLAPNVLSERLADKAKIAELEGERDAWKEVCRYAGICMACARGNLREPCTDCLGTGWNYGVPAEVLEAQAALRASQDALGRAASDLKALLAATDHRTPIDVLHRTQERARQTLAQVEGGGEDKGSIPGPRPDDLRASRGEGSGS